MRFDVAVIAFSLLTSAAATAIDGPRNVVRMDAAAQSDEHDLFKRRGGGGRGGGGGGGGSRGGGSSSKGGNSGGGGGSTRGKSSSPGNTKSTSNAGGTSPGGTGRQPTYGGGRYYGGGAAAPYTAGKKSRSNITPVLFGAGAAALLFWPGVWLYGAYLYPYHDNYRYHNATTDEDEDKPVVCGCAKNAECSCDDTNANDTLSELIGNGSYAAWNHDLVNVAEYKGKMSILINGTLENGTTAESEAPAGMRNLVENLGYWPAAVAVMAAVLVA